MARGPEGKVQDKANHHAKQRGLFYFKVESPTMTSLPDYAYSHANCGLFFIEYKAPGKKPTAAQTLKHKEMAAKGCLVFWTDSSRIAMEIIDDMVDHGMPVRHAPVSA